MKTKMYGIYRDGKGRDWQVILNLHFGRWMIKQLDKAITGEVQSHVILGMTYIRQATEFEKVNIQ